MKLWNRSTWCCRWFFLLVSDSQRSDKMYSKRSQISPLVCLQKQCSWGKQRLFWEYCADDSAHLAQIKVSIFLGGREGGIVITSVPLSHSFRSQILRHSFTRQMLFLLYSDQLARTLSMQNDSLLSLFLFSLD